jgi:hypothetical protein
MVKVRPSQGSTVELTLSSSSVAVQQLFHPESTRANVVPYTNTSEAYVKALTTFGALASSSSRQYRRVSHYRESRYMPVSGFPISDSPPSFPIQFLRPILIDKFQIALVEWRARPPAYDRQPQEHLSVVWRRSATGSAERLLSLFIRMSFVTSRLAACFHSHHDTTPTRTSIRDCVIAAASQKGNVDRRLVARPSLLICEQTAPARGNG